MSKEQRFYAGFFLFIGIIIAYVYIASAFEKYTVIASVIFAILLIAFGFCLIRFPAFRQFIKKGFRDCSILLLDLFSSDESRAKKPPRKEIPDPTKQLVVDRAGGACQICGIKENCEIHHINEHRSDNNPKNLMLLCRNCHGKVRNYRREQLIRWRDRQVS